MWLDWIPEWCAKLSGKFSAFYLKLRHTGVGDGSLSYLSCSCGDIATHAKYNPLLWKLLLPSFHLMLLPCTFNIAEEWHHGLRTTIYCAAAPQSGSFWTAWRQSRAAHTFARCREWWDRIKKLNLSTTTSTTTKTAASLMTTRLEQMC